MEMLWLSRSVLQYVYRSHTPAQIDLQTGLEFRDATFLIGPKNNRTLKENMTIVLSLGVADLPDPKNSDQT